MSDPVADQYEAYPYPSRNPQDEKTRLIDGSPSNLGEVDHYVFGGARDFRLPFRALVAGGGTGDGAILLAQNLADRNCPAEIHYLDLSQSSRRIAEARATVRGLTNIRFHTGSLLDLPALDLGRFDYIDCCGVLHHLENPSAGLAALAAVMASDGGMGLMLYGALGRSGVYEAQAMLKALGSTDEPLSTGIDLAKRLIGQLPATNALARNPAIGDYRRGEDAALVDLLLHRRDRAYRVAEIVELVSGAGLEIVSFINPWRYDPDSYLNDARLKARVARLSPLDRAGFAEMLAGNIKSHMCYVVASGRAASAMARPDDPSAIPVLREADGAAFARAIKDDRISVRSDGLEMSFALPRLAAAILSRIDGKQSIGEIGRRLEAGAGIRPADFDKDFAALYKVMNGIGRMTIRRAHS
jgi:SAM-dependent methyltransferase